MAVSLVVTVIIPAAGILAAVAHPVIILTITAAAAIVAIVIARGNGISAPVPTTVVPVAVVASILSEGLLIAYVARAYIDALVLP